MAETAGTEVVKRFTQKPDQAHSVTYVGKGKLEEIKEYIRNEEGGRGMEMHIHHIERFNKIQSYVRE